MNLNLFFKEKDIPYEYFDTIEHTDQDGNLHIIELDTNYIIELIKGRPQGAEREGLKKMLSKLDFLNQPIAPYLRHLAKGYAQTMENKQINA